MLYMTRNIMCTSFCSTQIRPSSDCLDYEEDTSKVTVQRAKEYIQYQHRAVQLELDL